MPGNDAPHSYALEENTISFEDNEVNINILPHDEAKRLQDEARSKYGEAFDALKDK